MVAFYRPWIIAWPVAALLALSALNLFSEAWSARASMRRASRDQADGKQG